MNPSAARRHLEKLARSSQFAHAPRLLRLLRYVVEAELNGKSARLCQDSIAKDVFDRGENFDSAIDSVVRVEAARLRTKLRDYYASDGQTDRLRFELPKGGYTPIIYEEELDSPASVPANISTPSTQPTLAVRPFEYLSSNPEQQYFADGITEDIITELARNPGLLVLARHSTAQFQDVTAPIATLRSELGATHVLEGSVRKLGERIRITAQLIDTQHQRHLWAEKFDRLQSEIFSVQDEVIQAISESLALELGYGGYARPSATDAKLEAYELVLQGRSRFVLFDQEQTARARELYEQAIALDSQSAVAHARLADAHVFQGMMGWSSSNEESVRRGLQCAERAIELDPESSIAHAALAWALLWNGIRERSIEVGRRAIELGPSDAGAHMFFGLCLAICGQSEEALKVLERAKTIDPLDNFYFPRGLACFYADRFEEALELFKNSIVLHPNFMPSRLHLAACCGFLGFRKLGGEQLAIVRKLSPTHRMGQLATLDHIVRGLRALQSLD